MINPLDPALIRARLSGKSYWVLLYTDGTILPEWRSDWPLAPVKGRRAVRLYCPNGQVAELDCGHEAERRLFQFKVAVASIRSGRHLRAHVIGRIDGLDGRAQCYAWEPGHPGDDGKPVPGRLVSFIDNAYAMAYENVGALCADHLGMVPA